MKFISLIGYSGSGKTHFITTAINRLKLSLDLSIIVIKDVHIHSVDTPGKDSFEFSNAGADFSIIKNKDDEIAIFFKKDIPLEKIIDWISKLLDDIDLVFFEGFRGLKVPGVLCAKNFEEIESQLNSNIKMISGLISNKIERETVVKKIPIINIESEFERFLEIFAIQ
jgi:molybdopterin-guanine dinucleotide biosynthesis protein B